MSIETEADRLEIIRTLAGIDRSEVTVRHPEGQFDAIFDSEYHETHVGAGPGVETRKPVLTARTIDVQGLAKDVPLELTHADGTVHQYRFKRHEPDGAGISLVYVRD